MLKSWDIILQTKVHIVTAMVFLPSGHIRLWELNHKEGRTPKNWCLRTVVLKKTSESLLDSKEINQSILREINHEYSLEGLMLKLQYFGHLIWTANSLEKSLMLGKTEGRRKRGRQRMTWLDGITDGQELGQTPGDGEGQEARHAAVHGVVKNQTWLSTWTTTLSNSVELFGHTIYFHLSSPLELRQPDHSRSSCWSVPGDPATERTLWWPPRSERDIL